MEAVARIDFVANNNDPAESTPITLRQFIDTHERFQGIGDTIEFTLAEREGDRIVFLLSHRHTDRDKFQPEPRSRVWTLNGRVMLLTPRCGGLGKTRSVNRLVTQLGVEPADGMHR